MQRIIYSIKPLGHLPEDNNIILKNKNDVFEIPKGKVFYLEDLDKKNTWLEINTVINFESNNLLIFGASKYYKLTSKKVSYLHMITEKCKSVFIIDYLFCCNGIENIYNPLSYIDRGLLGYAHWYAWKENYQEMYKGKPTYAFNPILIRSKIQSEVVYDLSKIERVFIKLKIDELFYTTKRDELFDNETPPNRLVTTLSDFVTNSKERAEKLQEWIKTEEIENPALVFNIKSNQRLYKSIQGDFYTYNDIIKNDNIIYVEPILVKEYLMDRIEQLNPSAQYYHIFDSTKVSKYLEQKVLHHISGNDELKLVFTG